MPFAVALCQLVHVCAHGYLTPSLFSIVAGIVSCICGYCFCMHHKSMSVCWLFGRFCFCSLVFIFCCYFIFIFFLFSFQLPELLLLVRTLRECIRLGLALKENIYSENILCGCVLVFIANYWIWGNISRYKGKEN